MSATSAMDLSGDWCGIYNYPQDLPAINFLARLVDSAGAISGAVEEPDMWASGHPAIGAVLDGVRDGATIRFVKYYEHAGGGTYDVVHYEGQIDPAGDEITGRWHIPENWSGTFIMTRRPRRGVTVENEVSEKAR